ncbi:putative legume lectin, alpha chain, concanavalin A-like lectin/glucanase domain superfamily [Helianthus annuus]|nr:putative legume lectin, alpha chain, concanavalin A-like lectin/glucanase domain superfamily [Helianthus annuus]
MLHLAWREWFSNIPFGIECTALIEYYSDSQNLRVSFTGFEEKSDVLESRLEYTIELRDWLPEWVIFGFSASTGNGSEINNVRSWMFNSTELEVDQGIVSSPTASLQINEVKGMLAAEVYHAHHLHRRNLIHHKHVWISW